MNATVKVWDPLAGLHVAGVVLASIRHRESLVKSMITGRKRVSGEVDVS